MKMEGNVSDLTGRVTALLMQSQSFEEERILEHIMLAAKLGDCLIEITKGEKVMLSFKFVDAEVEGK